MSALIDQAREPFVASEEEAAQAREATARLKPLAEAGQDVRLRVAEAPRDIVVPLPARALCLILEVLERMAARRPVSFIPSDAELTTKQAADYLNVSRPYLVGLIDRGEIPHRMVGTHRRVRVADLDAFKLRSQATRRAALARMAEEEKRLGLDD